MRGSFMIDKKTGIVLSDRIREDDGRECVFMLEETGQSNMIWLSILWLPGLVMDSSKSWGEGTQIVSEEYHSKG
jgi:hypothetical protein